MKKVIAGATVVFSFDGLAPVTFDAAKASAGCRAYAEMHGWQARIGDNAALSRKQPDGTVVTITEAMRREAVVELVAYYESGAEAWATRAAPVVKQNAAIAAAAARNGLTYSEMEARIANLELDKMDQI